MPTELHHMTADHRDSTWPQYRVATTAVHAIVSLENCLDEPPPLLHDLFDTKATWHRLAPCYINTNCSPPPSLCYGDSTTPDFATLAAPDPLTAYHNTAKNVLPPDSAGIPGAEVHLLSDSGHASHLEYPYTLARRRTPFESELP